MSCKNLLPDPIVPISETIELRIQNQNKYDITAAGFRCVCSVFMALGHVTAADLSRVADTRMWRHVCRTTLHISDAMAAIFYFTFYDLNPKEMR